MNPEISVIVEGEGEIRAVPALIRRIGESMEPPVYPIIHRPLRLPRTKIMRDGELERHVELAARKFPRAGILVLIDADKECPAEIGPQLLRRAQNTRSDKRLSAVIAKKEFEAWFIMAAESLRGKEGLPEDLAAAADGEAESIQDAKGWLSAKMDSRYRYRPTLHQEKFSNYIDLSLARRKAPSFDKFCREVESLLS